MKYIQGYDNNRNNSAVYREYLDEVEDFIVDNLELQNKKILEVGCGNGSFLNKICQKHSCMGEGYDPSYNGKKIVGNGQICFYNKYYDKVCADNRDKYDFVIFRHTIEHLQNPTKLLSQLRNSMKEKSMIYIETPCFNWILKNKVVFDIFYEHCSYYTKDSMENLLSLVGLEAVKIDYKFNNQYMCILAQCINKKIKLNRDFIKAMNEDIICFNIYKESLVLVSTILCK